MKTSAFISLLVIVIIISSAYLTFNNNFTTIDSKNNQEYPAIQDNFSNSNDLHWTHMPISYYIKNEKYCGGYELNRIKNAFKEIQNVTDNVVYFSKINNSEQADIEINCSFIKNCYRLDTNIISRYYYTQTETICEHDLGRAEITNQSENRILKAHIEFIGLDGFSETGADPNKGSGFAVGNCGHNNVEIHEILHTMGYFHSDNYYSIMFPQEISNAGFETYRAGQCDGSKRDVDKSIIENLIKIYGY